MSIGQLKITTLDGNVVYDGPAVEISETKINETQSVHTNFVRSFGDTSASFTAVGQVYAEALLTLLGIRKAIAETCGNKRVVHLMNNHKKEKIRLKNLHRSIRILERKQ